MILILSLKFSILIPFLFCIANHLEENYRAGFGLEFIANIYTIISVYLVDHIVNCLFNGLPF